jgi:hypothetical protein
VAPTPRPSAPLKPDPFATAIGPQDGFLFKGLFVFCADLFDFFTVGSPLLHRIEENQQAGLLLDDDALGGQKLAQPCEEGQAIGEARSNVLVER